MTGNGMDEWEDAQGSVSVGFGVLYPGTVLAAIAVIHAAVRQTTHYRADSIRRVNDVLTRLARRGGRRISEILHAQIIHLGTKKFEGTLRRAARLVALRAKPMRAQLIETVGQDASVSLKQLGPQAYLPRIDLSAEQSAPLLSHVLRGARLRVGIGKGDLFLPEAQDVFDHWPLARVNIDLAEIPDVSVAQKLAPLSVARVGGFRDDQSGCEVLASLRVRFGAVHVVLSYCGSAQMGCIDVDGPTDRLRIELSRPNGPVTLRLHCLTGLGP